MTEKQETAGKRLRAARPAAGTGRRRGRPRGSRNAIRHRDFRSAVQDSLACTAGEMEDPAREAADGYGRITDKLVRQAAEGDLKAVKLVMELLDGGGREEASEPVRVIVDV